MKQDAMQGRMSERIWNGWRVKWQNKTKESKGDNQKNQSVKDKQIQLLQTNSNQVQNKPLKYSQIKIQNQLTTNRTLQPLRNNKRMPKNIFPLHLIKVAQNTQIMVELKSGQTYNGTLKGVDKFMNIKMQSCIRTDAKGEVFHQVKDVYIRGNVLKYFTFENEAISKIQGTEYRPPENWKKSQNKDAKRLEKSKAKV